MRRALQHKFHERMLELYRCAATETRYKPTYFLRMVEERGGVEAARELLNSDKPAEGLYRLWELGRLDLSLEAVIAEETNWWPIFSETEIDTAKSRLAELGHRVE